MQQKQISVSIKHFKRLNQTVKQTINKQTTGLHKRGNSDSPTRGKSFRSHYFESKLENKEIPKIGKKDVILHQPVNVEGYLSRDFTVHKYNDDNPQIWGCLLPKGKRILNQVKPDAKKWNLNTTDNFFKSYIRRKSRLQHGISLKSMRNSEPSRKSLLSKTSQQTQVLSNRHQPERFYKSAISKIRSNYNSFQRKEHVVSSQRKCQPTFVAEQYIPLQKKSIYKMSLEELKQGLKWKKIFLDKLNDKIAKRNHP